jgi:radical SAM protein with 4Fe4S-binding SPASM domain
MFASLKTKRPRAVWLLVYPCAFLQDGIFLAGNVTRQSLESIWRESSAFRMVRNLRIQSCRNCSRFDLCHGGCPAVAYFLTRSLDHSDPECMATFRENLAAEDSMTGQPA